MTFELLLNIKLFRGIHTIEAFPSEDIITRVLSSLDWSCNDIQPLKCNTQEQRDDIQMRCLVLVDPEYQFSFVVDSCRSYWRTANESSYLCSQSITFKSARMRKCKFFLLRTEMAQSKGFETLVPSNWMSAKFLNLIAIILIKINILFRYHIYFSEPDWDSFNPKVLHLQRLPSIHPLRYKSRSTIRNPDACPE